MPCFSRKSGLVLLLASSIIILGNKVSFIISNNSVSASSFTSQVSAILSGTSFL